MISIVTINYNNSGGLEKTLKSIASQKNANYELILVDGGSSDKSIEVINKFSHIINKEISEPDNGITDAFNKGTKIAEGDYINYLNSGDIYADENVLYRVSKLIAKYSNYDWIYGLRYRVDSSGKSFKARKNELKKYNFSDLLKGNILISHQASFFKNSVIKAIGMYDARYPYLCMDYDLMLRFGKIKQPLQIKDYYVNYDVTGISANFYYQSLVLKHKIRIRHGKYKY